MRGRGTRLIWLVSVALQVTLQVSCSRGKARLVPNGVVESKAVPSSTHPLAGFWKQDCKHEFGIAIGPASDKLYFLSYCTPRGCFEEGTWRPNSPIYGDPSFRVVDEDHIEFVGKEPKFMRCAGRVSSD